MRQEIGRRCGRGKHLQKGADESKGMRIQTKRWTRSIIHLLLHEEGQNIEAWGKSGFSLLYLRFFLFPSFLPFSFRLPPFSFYHLAFLSFSHPFIFFPQPSRADRQARNTRSPGSCLPLLPSSPPRPPELDG